MPAVPTGLEPLPFDTVAADAAIEACRTAVVAIESTAYERRACAAWASQEWRGPARERSDLELAAVDGTAADLTSRLHALAAAIQAAGDAVAARNVVRAEARARWLAEQGGG